MKKRETNVMKQMNKTYSEKYQRTFKTTYAVSSYY